MDKLKFECRRCKRETLQVERKETDLLPPVVKTLECTVCGVMGVCLEGSENAPAEYQMRLRNSTGH
jgi:hypothetical protein